MPYIIRKLPNKDLYKVINKETKVVHSYGSTYENAIKQVRLLNMVDAGVPLRKNKKKGGNLPSNEPTSSSNENEPSSEIPISLPYPPVVFDFANAEFGAPTIEEATTNLQNTRASLADLDNLYEWDTENPAYLTQRGQLLYYVWRAEQLLNAVVEYHQNLQPEIVGEGLTEIDKTSTGVIRIKLNKSATTFLDTKLKPLITDTTIRITDTRKNAGTGRTQVFGYGNRRKNGFGEFKNNFNYPELYRALLIFGMKIVPDYIPFTAIQVNHNYKTKKHIDKNNIGLSLAVSFGDFTGGELVVGKSAYQTKEYPVIFNGALTEHFNKPISGDRYSLIYFVSAPMKYSDEEIYHLHNKILSNIKLMKGEGLIGGSIETDRFEADGTVSLPEFRSIKIDLPTYMYKRLPDIKGKSPPYRYKLVIPITSTRNISSRKQETSINISQKPVAKPLADIVDSGESPNLKDFSPADRLKIQEYYYKVRANENKNPDEIDKDEYVIKTRGKPLPCNNAVRPRLFIQPKVKLPIGTAKKRPASVLNLPPKSNVSSFESGFASSQGSQSSQDNQGGAKSRASIASKASSKSADANLLVSDLEGFLNKYGLDKSKKKGKGIENNISINNNKMANKWIEYVKSYAAKNGMKYSEALKDPKCKAGYKTGGAINPNKLLPATSANQDTMAEIYNETQLGQSAGKKYISL